MTTKLSLTGIVFIACLTSCSESSFDFSHYYAERIVNAWMDDYMDGCGGGDHMMFKPVESMDFTMWRYRNRLELLTDGTATYTLASREDPRWTGSIQSVRGTWTFDTGTMILLILDANGQILYSFQVHHVGEDFLSLSYMETVPNPLPK